MSNFLKFSLKTTPVVVRSLLRPAIVATRNNSSKSDERDEPVFDMENPFQKEKQQCILCRMKIIPNYKNVQLLSQFQSPYTGKIYGKHITGLCETQQKLVESEIVKAQNVGLMGTYLKEPQYLKDPQLYDADNPLRPHRF